MSSIFKYPLNGLGPTTLSLPNIAQVLAVKEQYGDIVLYANFWEDNASTEKEAIFYSAFTGQNTLPNPHDYHEYGEWKYIDTVIVGAFVIHVFQLIIP